MQAEIITIGNELLIGQVVDTNSAFIAEKLREAGVELTRITTVSDKRDTITLALTEAMKRSELVLMTGGLGPTNDDITKSVLMDLFGGGLVESQQVLADLKRFLSRAGIPLNANNRSQALVPENCQVIRNPVGTAPILWFDRNQRVVVAMPGVPLEMKTALTGEIIPRIRELYPLHVLISQTIRVAGYAESVLAERLGDWEAALPKGVSLAYLPSYGQIRLRLDATGESAEVLKKVLDHEIGKLKIILGKAVFAWEDIELQEAIGRLAVASAVTFSTAESCTGGLIGHLVTSIPGSSAYFLGSVVAYDNRVKSGVLGVDSVVIDSRGAVSAEVAEQMARRFGPWPEAERVRTDLAPEDSTRSALLAFG